MLRRMMGPAAALLMLPLGGCGGSKDTPTDSSTPAAASNVTITATPAEAAAGPSTDPGYQWATSFSLSLTESGGVAVTVRAVTVNVQQASGGTVVTPPAGLSEAFRYQLRSPGNRLAANGSLAVGLDVLYTLPQPGQEALVTVGFTLVDDSGSLATKTVQVKVV